MSDEFDFDLGSDHEADMMAAAAHANGKRTNDIGADGLPNKRVKTGHGLTSTSSTSPNTLLANRILKERFGLKGFRLEQEAAITRVLDGGSAVVVFPTGGGKSLCYQAPAVCFRYQDEETGRCHSQQSGVTLVISPLIALMKDQVDALLRRGIKAAVLNSSVSRDLYLATQEDLRNGKLDLLYCAPERLNNEGFIASLKEIPGGIRMLAVDEAHCISEWGHSFRPDYLKIARFAKEANVERVICLTATATEKVAEDVRNAFSIPEEGLFRTTMYRPNLRLLAEANPQGTDYKTKLVAHLKKYPGPTIVYVTLQKHTESLANELVRKGFKARPYHAGMNTDLRTKTQDDFLPSKNMIVVATIAFGMGIDKPDIRNIVHFDIPDSIESYSQQIGRAGRDGKPSVCMFYLATKDFHLRNIFTYGTRPSLRSLKLLLAEICSPTHRRLKVGDTFQVALYTLSKECDISPTILSIIFAQLELHYHLFRAAGTLYTTYKYTTKDAAHIANDNTPAARSIKNAPVKSTTKFRHIAVDDLAKRSGIDRTEYVRTLNRWNENGAIELKCEGVQNLFRLERAMPSNKQELEDIVKQLDESMGATETANIGRTKALIDLITDESCFSRALAAYFGETGTSAPQECGHCTWCETHTQVVLPNEPPQSPDPEKVREVLAKIAVRDDPRFLAKMAFGIKCPRGTAMGVYSSGVFESMNVCDFNALLETFTKACDDEWRKEYEGEEAESVVEIKKEKKVERRKGGAGGQHPFFARKG